MIEHVFDPPRHRAWHLVAEYFLPLERGAGEQHRAQLAAGSHAACSARLRTVS